MMFNRIEKMRAFILVFRLNSNASVFKYTGFLPVLKVLTRKVRISISRIYLTIHYFHIDFIVLYDRGIYVQAGYLMGGLL